MFTPRPVRFCLPIRKTRDPRGNATHALVGLKYLEALLKTNLVVVPVPIESTDWNALEIDPAWKSVQHVFVQHERSDLDTSSVVMSNGMPDMLSIIGQFKNGNFVNKNRLPDKLGDDFVNVVCSFGGTSFHKFLTHKVYNVAITVAWPRLPNKADVGVLQQYDVVCCPNGNDVAKLQETGLTHVMQLPIRTESLEEFFNYSYDKLPKKHL